MRSLFIPKGYEEASHINILNALKQHLTFLHLSHTFVSLNSNKFLFI